MAGANDGWRAFSRRELLKRVGGASAAAALPSGLFLPVVQPATLTAAAPHAQVAQAGDALQTLSVAEAEALEAIVARLIPSDESGPGAAEAGAARYIDRALAGALAPSRDTYRAGLAALDVYARSARGAVFARLSAADQDAVLGELENDAATGFTPRAGAFFNLVLAHTIQGTFCDPHYGGNANFVGWDLLGYPGVRLAVTAEEQQLDARPEPTHRSAYDHPMFSGGAGQRASRGRAGGSNGD